MATYKTGTPLADTHTLTSHHHRTDADSGAPPPSALGSADLP